jgi:hypothetical protein
MSVWRGTPVLIARMVKIYDFNEFHIKATYSIGPLKVSPDEIFT